MVISQDIFLEKVESNKGILIKVSKMYMDSKEDQEDLRQEIIYQLWKSIEKFKGSSEFSTWMYRVALNTAITFLKKNRKRPEEIEFSKLNEPITEVEDVKSLQLQKFYKAVKSLNKIEKALILLFIDGHSHLEIGKNLGISEGNARVKLNRTKNKLQEIIKNQENEF